MALVLVPLVGPFHLRFPRYNAVTVRDMVASLAPRLVLTSALPPGAFDAPTWQDVDEVALPLAVVPWARSQRVPVEAVGEPSPDPDAQADFERYLGEARGGQDALARLHEVRGPLGDLLAKALDARRVVDDLLPAVARERDLRLELFGDGPGTDWGEARADRVAERVREHLSAAPDGGAVALLAPVEGVPALRERLPEASLAEPAPPSDEARRRALLDAALGGEAQDPERMLAALREEAGAEARLAEADLLLARGHVAEALERLETASHGDFSRPYHVPGWLLARLGQLYDLAGRREDARRAYRGTLALSWAPAAAREAARDGLETPFAPPGREEP